MSSKKLIQKILHGQLGQLTDYLENIKEHAPEIFGDFEEIYADIQDVVRKVKDAD